MNESEQTTQLGAHQRAQTVIFSSATRRYLFSWAWMQRAELDCKADELGIVFPGKVVVISGKLLSDLLSSIADGTVTAITQVLPGKEECHSGGTATVACIKFLAPDDYEPGGEAVP